MNTIERAGLSKKIGRHKFIDILKRIAGSSLVWLLLMLWAVDWAVVNLHPLRYWIDASHSAFIPLDLNSVVSKLPPFLASSDQPEVILLGSSLPMNAISSYDEVFADSVDNKNFVQVRNYVHAKYLSSKLSEKAGHKVTVANLTCVACMASDAYLILRKAIQAGKTPHMVIYGMGPRDFIDNQVPPIGATPVYELLSDWVSIRDFLGVDLSADQKRDLLISQMWHYYSVRADYRQVIMEYAGTWLNRPISCWDAQQAMIKSKKIESPKSKITAVVSDKQNATMVEYNLRYNPLNKTRWEQELKYFDMLAKLCRDKKIKLLVANMPISQDNQNLLKAGFYNDYVAAARAITQKDGGIFVNLNDHSRYPASDFSDTVHLNAVGGKKAQDDILQTLAKTENI